MSSTMAGVVVRHGLLGRGSKFIALAGDRMIMRGRSQKRTRGFMIRLGSRLRRMADQGCNLNWALIAASFLGLHGAQAVLGGDGASKTRDNVMDNPRSSLALGRMKRVLAALRSNDIIVDIAIPHMAKGGDPAARREGEHGLADARSMKVATLLTGTETSCFQVAPSGFCPGDWFSLKDQRALA